MKVRLSSKQKNDRKKCLYEMIITAYEERRFPSSIREICKALGFASTSSAHRYLRELEEEGKIVLVRGINRGIMLPPVAV